MGFAPFRWLGVIGYSVFLWHMPIIHVVARYPFLAELSPQKQQFLRLTYRVLAITIPLSVVYYHLVSAVHEVSAGRRTDHRRRGHHRPGRNR